jgi:hypothetical protein
MKMTTERLYFRQMYLYLQPAGVQRSIGAQYYHNLIQLRYGCILYRHVYSAHTKSYN